MMAKLLLLAVIMQVTQAAATTADTTPKKLLQINKHSNVHVMAQFFQRSGDGTCTGGSACLLVTALSEETACIAELADDNQSPCTYTQPTVISSTAPPPTSKVITLIEELKARAEEDHRLAQESYDAYACWCEAKVSSTAGAMGTSKTTIEKQQALIIKTKGELAALVAQAAQITKDIAANNAAVKEATAVRDGEYAEYAAESKGREESIAAMEGGIKVLAGGHAAGIGFLDKTTKQAQLSDAVEKMRSVVNKDSLPAPAADVELLKSFVAKPESFLGGASALQVGQNPMGDYASASTRIQGILKGMYDSFTAEVEKGNVEEANSQKSFEALTAIKATELRNLNTALAEATTGELGSAFKAQVLATAQTELEDTKEQLAADEAFFSKTKDACQEKSVEWSHQSRLRTQELSGLNRGIAILSSLASQSTFGSAFGNSFMQTKSSSSHKALEVLNALATKYKRPQVAKVAALLATKTGGHFDNIIASVDALVVNLRSEEAADLRQKDTCELEVQANNNALSDAGSKLAAFSARISAMSTELSDLRGEITGLGTSVTTANKTRNDLVGLRATAVEDYEKAVKDDTEAIGLMKQASAAMGKFFAGASLLQTNAVLEHLIKVGVPASCDGAADCALKTDSTACVADTAADGSTCTFTAASPAAPAAANYSVNPHVAPQTTFSGKGYSGRASETQGVVAILSMLMEDLQKEVQEASADNAAAEKVYVEQVGALTKSIKAYQKTKAAKEAEAALLAEREANAEELKSGVSADQGGEQIKATAIAVGCSKFLGDSGDFETRKIARKAELDGLADAKSYLSGGL